MKRIMEKFKVEEGENGSDEQLCYLDRWLQEIFDLDDMQSFMNQRLFFDGQQLFFR